jgi:hypothetical protein
VNWVWIFSAEPTPPSVHRRRKTWQRFKWTTFLVLLQALGLDVCLHFLCLPLQTSDTVLVNELGEVVWQASGLDPERGNLIIEFIKLKI